MAAAVPKCGGRRGWAYADAHTLTCAAVDGLARLGCEIPDIENYRAAGQPIAAEQADADIYSPRDISLRSEFPDVAAEWHQTRNTTTSDRVAPSRTSRCGGSAPRAGTSGKHSSPTAPSTGRAVPCAAASGVTSHVRSPSRAIPSPTGSPRWRQSGTRRRMGKLLRPTSTRAPTLTGGGCALTVARTSVLPRTTGGRRRRSAPRARKATLTRIVPSYSRLWRRLVGQLAGCMDFDTASMPKRPGPKIETGL